MKFLVVLFAVFCAIQASASEDSSSSSGMMACVTDKIDRLVDGRNDMYEWTADVYATINRLYDQRQRCNKIPR